MTKLLGTKDRPAARSLGEGLQIAATAKGTVSWRLRYRMAGVDEIVTLGRWPSMDHAKARQAAQRMRRRIGRGENPAAERREQRKGGANQTVRQFGARWIADVVRKSRKHTKPVERLLEREVYPAIGRRPIAWVTAREVQRIIFTKRDAGHPIAARTLQKTLNRLFAYARVCQLAPANPVDATPLKYVGEQKARTRSLTREQLRSFYQRIAGQQLNRRIGLALEVTLLTLCRKSELRLARWGHIDLDRALWEVPAELSKSGLPHVVYLSRQAVERLAELKRMAGRAEMVLPARDSVTQPITASAINRAMRRVKWNMPHFTPHDLRRTASTILNELGYNPDWIEKALNHTVRGVRGVYNRAQYAEQRRRMLQEWADWLDEVKA